jgi:hypothetical protein
MPMRQEDVVFRGPAIEVRARGCASTAPCTRAPWCSPTTTRSPPS